MPLFKEHNPKFGRPCGHPIPTPGSVSPHLLSAGLASSHLLSAGLVFLHLLSAGVVSHSLSGLKWILSFGEGEGGEEQEQELDKKMVTAKNLCISDSLFPRPFLSSCVDTTSLLCQHRRRGKAWGRGYHLCTNSSQSPSFYQAPALAPLPPHPPQMTIST